MDKQVAGATSSKKSNAKSEITQELEKLVGHEVYSSWIKMLQALVPHGRTHRLAVLVAGMLQYALDQGNVKSNSNNSVSALLEEANDNNEFDDDLLYVVQVLMTM